MGKTSSSARHLVPFLLIPFLLTILLSAGRVTRTQAQPPLPDPIPITDPDPGTFSVNVTASPPGSGTVTKQPDKLLYASGEQVTLSAVANEGWQFETWGGDISGTTSPITITVTGNMNITATFTKRCYTLSLTKVGEGDVPTANPEKSPSCTEKNQYVQGEPITLTAKPAGGWQVQNWSGTDNDASSATTNTWTMQASNHEISVTYSQICYMLSVSVNPSGGGNVSRSPEPNCQGTKYASGTTVQLSANPANGYVFNNWTGAVTGSTNPTAVTMNGDRNVTANFAKACYALVLTHTGEGSDPTANPNKSPGCEAGRYNLGATIDLTAAPAAGWRIAGWTGADNGGSNTTNVLTMPATNGHIVSVTYIEKPTLQFDAANYSVNEDAGTATITLVRTGSQSESVSVKVRSQNGTANAGVDYQAVDKTVTFGSNEASKTFTVTVLDDAIFEGTEDLTLTLSNPSNNAKLGAPTSAKLNILDDEGEPTIQFSSTTFSVDEAAATAEISISLVPVSSEDVFVDLATVGGGTATPGSDYQGISGQTIRFRAGEGIKRVALTIRDDALDEPNETVRLKLSEPVRADLGQDEATLTIIDDDDPPTVQFTEAEYYAIEGAGSKTVGVTLSEPSSFTVSVNYEMNGVQADSPTSNTGSISFAPGETTATFDVPLAGKRAGSSVILILRSPDNATFGSPSSAQLYVLDENRSECHQLLFSHSGYGRNPEPTNMLSSLGCPSGHYVAGELISVSATADKGWFVSGWQGTLNENTSEADNVVRMPDSNHVVQVNYMTATFMPGVSNNFTTYFEGTTEREPNGSFPNANGPLKLGTTYQGSFAADDVFDVYQFYLPQSSAVEISLTNIVYQGNPNGLGYNLALWNDNSQNLASSASTGTTAESISTGTLAPGVYFISVHNPEGVTSISPYRLVVNKK